MQAGRVENPAPLLARAMRLDEEPLASEGEVRDEVFFCVLTSLLQHIQLLRQFQREVLAQLDVQYQRIDVVCHDWHRSSNRGDPSWIEIQEGSGRRMGAWAYLNLRLCTFIAFAPQSRHPSCSQQAIGYAGRAIASCARATVTCYRSVKRVRLPMVSGKSRTAIFTYYFLVLMSLALSACAGTPAASATVTSSPLTAPTSTATQDGAFE